MNKLKYKYLTGTISYFICKDIASFREVLAKYEIEMARKLEPVRFPVCYIFYISVPMRQQGKGIGTKLVRSFLSKIKVNRFYLESVAEWRDPNRFDTLDWYKRLGFSIISSIPSRPENYFMSYTKKSRVRSICLAEDKVMNKIRWTGYNSQEVKAFSPKVSVESEYITEEGTEIGYSKDTCFIETANGKVEVPRGKTISMMSNGELVLMRTYRVKAVYDVKADSKEDAINKVKLRGKTDKLIYLDDASFMVNADAEIGFNSKKDLIKYYEEQEKKIKEQDSLSSIDDPNSRYRLIHKVHVIHNGQPISLATVNQLIEDLEGKFSKDKEESILNTISSLGRCALLNNKVRSPSFVLDGYLKAILANEKVSDADKKFCQAIWDLYYE